MSTDNEIPSPPEADRELSSALRSVFQLFRRRLRTFVGVTIVVFAAIVIGTLMLEPQYEAVTRIRIEPNRSATTGIEADRTTTPDTAVIDTEVSVLKSRDLAREVVRILKLQYDPVLTDGLPHLAAAPSPQQLAARVETVTNRVLAKTLIEREPKTYVINVGFQSPSPELAARIANGFASAYINNSVGTRSGTAAQQARTLEQRLAALGQEVRAADAQIAQYRASAGIVTGSNNATVTDQQVGPLSSQLADAESAAAAARSNLAAARAQVASGQLETVAGVLNSGVVADLRRQRAEVVRNMSEVQTRYGPKHPETLRVTQQLVSIDMQIREEAQRVTDALQSQASAAAARAESLRAALNQIKQEQASNTRASVTVESLEREVEAKRATYNRLAEAVQQANQIARNSTPQATVIEEATIPQNPAFPNKKLLFGAGFLLALIMGTGVISVQEMLSHGFRTSAEVEHALGLPVIAAIPLLRPAEMKEAGDSKSPPELIIARETSFYAEAIRNIRTALLLSSGTHAPKIISVVSTLPGEGKSTTAISLARVMALSGDRVLLIDGDLRRAGLRKYAAAAPTKGLVEVLQEECALSEALVADAVPGLDMLYVCKPTYLSADLLGQPGMRALLDEFAKHYDRIIIDTPPLLGLADSRTLAALSDTVLLVLQWNKTPAHTLEAALSTLQFDGIRPIGVAFSMVDRNSEVAGASYYGRRYAEYYSKK